MNYVKKQGKISNKNEILPCFELSKIISLQPFF